MNANVESLKAIGIARRIEQPVSGFVIGARSLCEAQHRAIGLGDDMRRVR